MQVFGSNAPAIVVPPVPGSLLTHELTDHCTSSNYLYNSSVESIKTTAATTAPECNKFHKRVAELIANKRKEQYSKVLSYIRTRISFAMLKSILVSIHGVRDKRGRKEGEILYASDVAFGLIPEEESYECR